jgi:hypothetical protein
VARGGRRPSPRERDRLARADRPLALAWGLASAGLALRLAGGVLLLARARRRWTRRDVLGVPVLVAESRGPAVVGLRPATIVVPAWALAMDAGRLGLMLRHEQEHVRARDGLLLWAAQLAIVLMPWSPALWWMLARLRAAVEIDCDARVLRGASPADVRAYGTLLLDTAWLRAGTAVGAPAFAVRADQLERRLRAMAERPRDARRGAALAATVGVAAVLLACEAPHPRGVTATRDRSIIPAAPASRPTAPTELVAVYVGAEGPHALTELRTAVRAMQPLLRARAAAAGQRFVSVGASLGPGVEAARADLATVGAFDEVSLGGNGRNTMLTRYALRGVPAVVVLERPGGAVPVPGGVERELARVVGVRGIVEWVRAGAPVPAGGTRAREATRDDD